MAWIDLSDLTAKSDVARRTSLGRKSIAFPDLGTGVSETNVTFPSCAGCSKLASHTPCEAIGFQPPHGEGRYDRLASANRMTVDDWLLLQGALHLTDYVVHGHIRDDVHYNAGEGGDNASQAHRYEIVAAAGNNLTLKGRNPKRLEVTRLRLNPMWPFPDPVTGQEGRLVAETFAYSMPIGSSVEFLYPSALANKALPLVTSISPPATDTEDGVTFSVSVNQDVGEADTPWDLAFPPPSGKYYCKVRAEALRPGGWRNVQASAEQVFTRTTATINTAAVHELLDTGGSSTRILYPGWFTASFVVVEHLQAGGSRTWTNAEALALLTTTQSGAGSWATTLDTSALDFAATIDRLELTYHPEATASDTYRLWFAGRCANAQTDPSGCFSHAGGQYCARAETADAFGTFAGGCWQPDCSGFALGDSGAGFGPKSNGPEIPDSSWLASLWHRSSWVLAQQIVGYPDTWNYKLERRAGGGPSLGGLLGNWRRDASGTYVPTREEYFGPAFGTRVTWSDGDGDHHAIVYGMTLRAAYSESGSSNEWDASGSPVAGALASIFASQPDGLGGTLDTELARLPYRGSGTLHTYDYDTGREGLTTYSERWSSADAYITGADLSTEDSAFGATVRERWE